MGLAEPMVTPETECLLYATYWFRPILSELIGSARESSEVEGIGVERRVALLKS